MEEKQNTNVMPNGMEINLCDFALFLSVMKNKEAHEITLSIIMENPDLRLDEVHVEEIAGLHLDDGSTKIFLNMSGKNGPPELVSLLQYMRKTSLDNPNILVRDERMCRLDSIVTEVTESEEWEEISMSIYSNALERGEEIGKEIGQISHCIEQICKKLRKGKSLDVISEELEETTDTIRPLYELALKFAPDFDSNAVIEFWLLTKNK